jgi:hypothetical protein
LPPLMSNVSRHMQPSHASGSAVKENVVLLECAAWRSAVGYRKAQLAQPLCRAVRPAAAGSPIVEAPPEQRLASCRAVRPSAASAPLCMRAQEQEFGGLRGHGQCFGTQGNSRASSRPCEYAAPALHLFFRHGRHRPSTAHAGVCVGSIRRMHTKQARGVANTAPSSEQRTP